MSNKFRNFFLRLTQLFLAGDGVLHLASVGSSIYEEAWGTACITGLQTFLFFIGVYFIGHDHTHHNEEAE